MTLLDHFLRAERNRHVYLAEFPLHPCTSVEPYVALLEPFGTLKLVESFEHCLCTYAVCSVWVCEVTCKIYLVWLNLLEELNDDINVGLCALTLLDSSGFVERKVKEVAVCGIIETE